MSIDKDRSETIFKDAKEAYSQEQAIIEADRCLFCYDAPCMNACPTHIDVPQFIRKITTNNIKGSAKTIFESNILGMSCARVCPVEELCAGACVYNDLGAPPIQIGKLQRYSTDQAFENKWQFFTAGKDTGKSVGLIGAGPASLACAHELRRYGHRVSLYEKKSFIGGLNVSGIAPYKMRAERGLEEAQWVLDIGGIDVKTCVSVGDDLPISTLEKQHDALFFGIGLGNDLTLSIPGENLPGILGASAFIEHMKMSRVTTGVIQHCVVIGGGNTAMDAVREACGLGIPHVTLVYRGSQQQKTAFPHEWEAAQIAGAHAEWHALPIRFKGKNHIEYVECIHLDDNKQPISGTEFEIAADLVLIAIGQSKLGYLLSKLKGIELDKGRIVTDEYGRTGRKGVFAGGDCRNGGLEVVNAVAEGKAAALAINDYLTTGI